MLQILTVLKNIKSFIVVDFIHLENVGIIVTTNNVASSLNILTIEQYVKNINNIETSHINTLRLLQSKSYLKIISIPYFMENTNMPITVDVVKTIIKENHIFNNIVLAL